MNPKKLVIVGAGGSGVEAAWVAEEMNLRSVGAPLWDILGFIDDNPELKGSEAYGHPVLGVSEAVVRELTGEIFFHCAIGKNRVRQKVATRLEKQGWKPATLIHPSVAVAKFSSVGHGVYIGAGSVVGPYARVGNHVIINTCVGIGHHSVIGDYAQICPGARVNGACRVDAGAFIGSNASLKPGVGIGEGATVGANSLVIGRVEPLTTVIGVPARCISRPAASESPAKTTTFLSNN